MKSKSRRYEVLLPARFNDGRDVPDDLLGKAIDEVIDQFHAGSYSKDAVEGSGATRARRITTAWVCWWSTSPILRSIANG